MSMLVPKNIFENHSILIPVGNDRWTTGPASDKDEGFVLEVLQQAVGGFIELVRLSDVGRAVMAESLEATCKKHDSKSILTTEDKECIKDICKNLMMVVNEEGLLMSLADNPEASLLSGQRIVGPAVMIDQRRLK